MACAQYRAGSDLEGQKAKTMRLTKQTGHAMRILIDCANAGGDLVKVAEISDRLGITKQNVFKIVHILSRAGFISATRGPSGGVRLARPATDIRVGDVVRAIETTDVEIEVSPAAHVPGGARSINTVFDDALTAFVSVLDQHTLADMTATRGKLPDAPGGAVKFVSARAPAKSARRVRRS